MDKKTLQTAALILAAVIGGIGIVYSFFINAQ